MIMSIILMKLSLLLVLLLLLLCNVMTEEAPIITNS